MISGESPPLNAADDILQKVCCHVHNKHILSYCVYIEQEMGSTILDLKHQRGWSPA